MWRTFVVLVWFHITLATFRARITTIHLYLSKLYLKHYWFHFFWTQCIHNYDGHEVNSVLFHYYWWKATLLLRCAGNTLDCATSTPVHVLAASVDVFFVVQLYCVQPKLFLQYCENNVSVGLTLYHLATCIHISK